MYAGCVGMLGTSEKTAETDMIWVAWEGAEQDFN
jgi:hypothetical protein